MKPAMLMMMFVVVLMVMMLVVMLMMLMDMLFLTFTFSLFHIPFNSLVMRRSYSRSGWWSYFFVQRYGGKIATQLQCSMKFLYLCTRNCEKRTFYER